MAHIPGPWKQLGLIVTDENGVLIADLRPRTPVSVFDSFSSNRSTPIETHLDNAALIAAAPDLLAALKKIALGEGRYSRDQLTHASNTIEDMKALARAAIAKAQPSAAETDET